MVTQDIDKIACYVCNYYGEPDWLDSRGELGEIFCPQCGVKNHVCTVKFIKRNSA